jgi:EAL domain-containing protein (putative c-di-GMP-specific phosphodiesterase class I)
MKDAEATTAALLKLKAIGVRIAIDDFGTGYSSLSYLSGLPIDCLKIDRSFVVQTTKGGRDATIAQAIISLAHGLELRVLAEGVETGEQLEFLKIHGCDECQGYLFAKPQPAAALTSALASGRLAPNP